MRASSSRAHASVERLAELGVRVELPAVWADCLEVRLRYRGYIEREQRLASQRVRIETTPLPATLWERELTGVSREAIEKLRRMRPTTIGQASRVAGVSPADVAVLLVLSRRERVEAAAASSRPT